MTAPEQELKCCATDTLHVTLYNRGSLPPFFDAYALVSLSIGYSGLTAGNNTNLEGASLPDFAMYDRQADCSILC